MVKSAYGKQRLINLCSCICFEKLWAPATYVESNLTVEKAQFSDKTNLIVSYFVVPYFVLNCKLLKCYTVVFNSP